MSTTSGPSTVTALRRSLGVGGVLAVIAGLVIVVWPGKTLAIVATIVAIYAIAAGLVYAGLAIFSRRTRGWARVGHLVLGLLFIVVGIVALMNLTASTGWLLVFVGIIVGIMWVVEGVVALTTLGDAPSKGWPISFAILSIIAGIAVLFAPAMGTLALWWVVGLAFIVLGLMNIVRAFRITSAF